MKTAALALVALSLTGCAAALENERQQFLRLNAAATGCPADEITISNHVRSTWQASCRGRTFMCSGLNGYECREAVKPAS
jgi:hypothetical protein